MKPLKRKKQSVKRRVIRPNVENEQLILSAMIKDPLTMRQLSVSLGRDLFVGQRHKEIFSVLREMASLRLEFDVETFEQLGAGRPYGGRKYILDVSQAYSEGQKNLDYHIGKLRVDAVKVGLLSGELKTLGDLCEDPSATMSEVQEAAVKLSRRCSVQGDGKISGSDLADIYVGKLKARIRSPEFVPTGLKELDDQLTEGLARGKQSCWFGRTAMGKSTLGRCVAGHAIEIGINTCYFAIEEGSITVLDGMVAAKTGITFKELIKFTDELTKKQWKQIRQATKEITEHRNFSIIQRRMTIRELPGFLMNGNFGLCVFDLWERMLPRLDQETVTLALYEMQELAKEFDCHMMLLHQMLRPDRGSKHKRPVLEALKRSGSWEEVMDLIISIHREQYYNPDIQENVAEISILKQKRGGLATVNYNFEGECGRIGEHNATWGTREEFD